MRRVAAPLAPTLALAAFLALVPALLAPPPARAAPGATVQAGDLVFHRSESAQSEAIARATGSAFTHVGIVLERDGALQVFEAVEPVGWARLDAWVDRGRDDAVTVLRLRDAPDAAALARMGEIARAWAGRPYDAAFGWSDDRLYCSELVWKMVQRATGTELGPLRKLRDFNVREPLVARALAQRYGGKPPWDDPVISPADVAASPALVPIDP